MSYAKNSLATSVNHLALEDIQTTNYYTIMYWTSAADTEPVNQNSKSAQPYSHCY